MSEKVKKRILTAFAGIICFPTMYGNYCKPAEQHHVPASPRWLLGRDIEKSKRWDAP